MQWEHVPTHVDVYGNEMAKGLAVEGMSSSLLWSNHVQPYSGSESTVGLQGGLDSDAAEMIWEEHVPAHVNVYGNEVANGLAVEGMSSSPRWSTHVQLDLGSESKVGMRGGLDSDAVEMMWEELGLWPIDSEELTREASGVMVTEVSLTHGQQ